MFRDEGVSVAEWARNRGFSAPLVYSVLSGRNRATRGESFQISVALGLRAPPARSRLISSTNPDMSAPRYPIAEGTAM